MINSINQSNLNMALRCGESFRRRYMLGQIIPPGIALLRGLSTHKAAEINHIQKVETRLDLSLDDLKDATRDKFVHTAQEKGVYLTKEEQSAKKRVVNDGLNDALRCTEAYHKDIAPTIQPIASELRLGPINVGLDLPISLRIDCLEKNHIIRDLKTTGKKPQKDSIKQEIQPVFYSLGYLTHFGEDPKFQYDYAIARRGKDGKPTSIGHDKQEFQATDKDYQALLYKMQNFIELLNAGVFPYANPTSWWCGSEGKYCGYYSTCPAWGNKPKKWI